MTRQASSGSRRRSMFLLGIIILVLGIGASLGYWWANGCWLPGTCKPAAWSDNEKQMLRSLWIGSLPALPSDPSNAVADDPRAAELGHKLFFDPRLSINGTVSCATCHQPEHRFTDAKTKGQAIATSKRNTLSLIGSAYSPWQYWDGRKDSQWSQALAPLEDPAEHGGNRMQYVRLIAKDPRYRTVYQSLFGPLPDFSDRQRFPTAASPIQNPEWQQAWHSMQAGDQDLVNRVFSNIGKAIAAYERLLLPGPSRFDDYVEAVLDGNAANRDRIFSEAEVRGLRLFIGKGRCTECHNGPLFSNNEFHNTGVLPSPGELPDRGRREGVHQVLADPFNCMGEYSDLRAENCAELRYARTGKELIGAVRTPSLRNLDGTGPFMHKGQMATLAQVLEHYNQAPAAIVGHNEVKPLGLSRRELKRLEAFLATLAGPVAADVKWLLPPDS